MILHVSNLKTRVLGPPTHSHQFDTNCGKTQYLSDPFNSFCLILKLSRALDGLFSVLLGLRGRKHKYTFCWMKNHWTSLLSDIAAWDTFWYGTHYLFSTQYRCCDSHSPCFGKYIFPQLQTCSADCTEGSCSSNIPSNF